MDRLVVVQTCLCNPNILPYECQLFTLCDKGCRVCCKPRYSHMLRLFELFSTLVSVNCVLSSKQCKEDPFGRPLTCWSRGGSLQANAQGNEFKQVPTDKETAKGAEIDKKIDWLKVSYFNCNNKTDSRGKTNIATIKLFNPIFDILFLRILIPIFLI